MIRTIAIYGMGCILGLGAALGQTPQAEFSVSQLTAVPGKTLPPGRYTIHVVDHLSDRYVLRVEGRNGQIDTEFLGIPDPHLAPGRNGMVAWKNPTDGAAYLRGWHFAGLHTGLEFAYPKADAVAIAKANRAQVPAIDPASEGMPVNTALSKSEMQTISLWLLTPTTVGPDAPAGIAARHYENVASLRVPPTIKQLPHTASELPWVWLTGGLTLLCALGLRMRGIQEDSTARG